MLNLSWEEIEKISKIEKEQTEKIKKDKVLNNKFKTITSINNNIRKALNKEE